MAIASGTKDDPWVLRTPPGSSEYLMHRDEQADPPALVCQVGSTTLKYHLRAIEDLHTWLVEQGDWVALGAADENKPAADSTVEAWCLAEIDALQEQGRGDDAFQVVAGNIESAAA